MKRPEAGTPQKGRSPDEMLLSCEESLDNAETRILLLQKLTIAISESSDFNEALNNSLETICYLTEWCYAEAWVPSPDGAELQCSPAWFKCSRGLMEFRELTRDMTFAPGMGLPGRVWKSNRSEWIKDVSAVDETLFLRLSLAKRCSLRACFGVPVTKNSEVMAVLLFFMHKTKEEDRGLVEIVSSLSAQFGALIHRKRIEGELEQSQRKLRNLSLSLQRRMEQDRQSLARRIHDEFGQAFSALKMELSWIRGQLNEDQKHLFQEINKINELIQNVLTSVQTVAFELRPHLLDNMGLIAAIRWKAKIFEERNNIRCRVKAFPDNIPIEQERAVALYRIFQESLFNVARHAEAGEVLAEIRAAKGRVFMDIIDDGKGITPAELADPGSIGLIGMQERAQSFGGRCSINGKPGRGTCVKVTMPVANYPKEKK